MPLQGVLSDGVPALLKNTQAQKVEASSTGHLALDELEPVNLAFDMIVVPLQPECFAHSVNSRWCGASAGSNALLRLRSRCQRSAACIAWRAALRAACSCQVEMVLAHIWYSFRPRSGA